MFRREGRLGHPEHDVETQHYTAPSQAGGVQTNLVGLILLAGGIVLLIYGAIVGLNEMISWFPWGQR